MWIYFGAGLLAAISVTLYLLFKRKKDELPRFVLYFLILDICSQSINMILFVYQWFNPDTIQNPTTLVVILNCSGNFLYLLAEWVFVMQYFKLSLLLPVVRELDFNRKEQR